MVYTAKEILPYFKNLVLAGQDFSGDLEWIGTDEQWSKVKSELYIDILKNKLD